MKKSLIFAALALAGASACLTSCKDNSDDNGLTYDNLTVQTKVDFDFEADYLELCDISVKYTDFNGVSHTVPVYSDEWEQTLSTSRFPASQNYELILTPKTDVVPSKAYYDLDFSVDYEATAYFGSKSRRVVPEYEVYLCTQERVPAAQVATVLQEVVNKSKTLNYNYTFTGSTLDNVAASIQM